MANLLIDQRMHPDDITTLIMDHMILGVQAISSTQAFLLYFLAKNPRVQRKLYDEVLSILPTPQSLVTENNIQQMSYLTACLQECLR